MSDLKPGFMRTNTVNGELDIYVGQIINNRRFFQVTELSEAQIQNKILRWAKNYPYKGRVLADYLVHVPNGEKRSKRVAAGLKHSGVKKGYPDLVMDIALNGYHGLRIELKTETGGVVSDEQKERLKMLNSEGYLAVVCKGFDEAIKTITDYMGIGQ